MVRPESSRLPVKHRNGENVLVRFDLRALRTFSAAGYGIREVFLQPTLNIRSRLPLNETSKCRIHRVRLDARTVSEIVTRASKRTRQAP
jgi:hypothetical protein